MIITCENCGSNFRLDESLIKESGSKVRCSNCQHIFTAYRGSDAQELGPEPGYEEKAPSEHEELAAQVASSGEMDESEGQGPEGSSTTPEEPLDFGLFGSEEEDDEGFSLEDFGLEEDDAKEETAAEEKIGEEEITAGDLGFEEEPATEEVPEFTVKKEGEQEMALEGLSPQEETVSEEGFPTSEEPSEEKAGVDEGLPFEDLTLEDETTAEEEVESEEELSFEDLTLEDEITAEEKVEAEDELSFEDLALEDETIAEKPPEATRELTPKEEVEEEISFEDGSPEEAATEEELIQEEAAEEETAEPSVEAWTPLAEDIPVASVEESEETEEEPQEEMPLPPTGEIQPPVRRGISTPLWVILVIVLVGGGAFAAYTLLKGRHIQIPFLKSLAGEEKSEIFDPGNRQITLLEDLITGEFVESKSAGRLFVIKGKIRSNYPEPRNFIKLKGVLYFKDGKTAKNRIVYCGNILSDTDLQSVDKQAINERMSDRFGYNKLNFNVQPGKAVPFMVVFCDVPQDLGEFSVEVVGSVPG